jgi:hypothetical protein
MIQFLHRSATSLSSLACYQVGLTFYSFVNVLLWYQKITGVLANNIWLRAGLQGDRGSIPGRDERIFPLASVSRPALGPTQPPVQWVPGVLSPGLKHGQGVTLTTHPHLVPRSRMIRSYISSPPSAFMACSGTALAFSKTEHLELQA